MFATLFLDYYITLYFIKSHKYLVKYFKQKSIRSYGNFNL